MNQVDYSVRVLCFLARGMLILMAGLALYLFWYSTAQAQTTTEVQVQCKDGVCTIAESDLAALLNSNNKAVKAYMQLKRVCKHAEI